MWRDNNDKIMDILANIETQNKELFPVVCPVCGEKDGHIYIHGNKKEDERGSMWVWCSACYHTAHAVYRLPKWWENSEKISVEELTSLPDYLEKNKDCIDEWVNKLIFLNLSNKNDLQK